MYKSYFLFLNILVSIQLFSQSILTKLPSEVNSDSLIELYGKNKHFIPQFQLQSLIALSFYPELKNTKISFMLADKESVAKTTVTFFSLLNTTNKHFIIYINSNKRRTGMLLLDTPFDAQVGAIGHELAHVSNFNKKNLPGMVWWAIKYLLRKTG